MSLIYDPFGTNPANYILDEVTTPVDGPHIAPIEGVFYTTGFVVEGKLKSGGAYVPLVLNGDYIYSPQFTTRTAETGIPAYSYILLTDYSRWSRIKMSYRGSGGAADQVLQAQIVTAGNFDTTNLTLWESFKGDSASIVPGGPDLDPRNSGVVYMLSGKLSAIAAAMQTPSRYLEFITNEWVTMLGDIQALQSMADNWETYFTGSGAGGTDLSAYSTTEAMNTAISTAVTALRNISLLRQTSDMTWYVNGDNTGKEDGLTPQTGFTTPAKAFKASRAYSANGKQKNIQFSNGVYAINTTLASTIEDTVRFIGNVDNPELCVIDGNFTLNDVTAIFSGFTFRNSGTGGCVMGMRGAHITFGEGIVFGECLGGIHVFMQGSTAIFAEPYKITGSAISHWVTGQVGIIAPHCDNIILENTPHFSYGFIRAVDYSTIAPIIPTATFTGTATGIQWMSEWSASVNFISPGTPYPGDVPGFFTSKVVPQLTANLTLYVNMAADPNVANGLTAATAVTTITDALELALGYDQNGHVISILIDSGTYNGFTIKNTRGGNIIIQGTGAVDTVHIDSHILVENITIHFENVKVSSLSASGAMRFGWGARATFGANITFGECEQGPHIDCRDNAFIVFTEPYKITGSATAHYQVLENGNIAINCDDITVTGNPTFSKAFCFAQTFGRIRPYAANIVFTGAAIGVKYEVRTMAIVKTAGGGPNWFPGDEPGTTDGHGLYF